MALRELLLKLGIDVDKSGVKNADQSLAKIKKAAIVAGAAFAAIKAVGAIKGVVDDVRAIGDELDKTSKQLGISTQALQEFRFAAGLAGVNGGEFSTSLRFLQKNAFEAARGSKSMEEAFAKAGVSVKDANGQLKNGEQLLIELGDGLAKTTNSTEKVAIAQTLMGRSGAKLLPLFEGGAEGMAKMREEARSLGGVLDQELIDATVQLTDDQFRLEQAWQGVKNEIATQVIPAFLKVTHAMTQIAKMLRGPVSVAFKIISGIFSAIGNIASFLNEKLQGLGTIFGTVATAAGTLGVAMIILGRKSVFAAIRFAAGWIAAAAPILLIMGLIGLLLLIVDDVVTFFKGGDSLTGRFVNAIRKWVRKMGGFTKAVGELFKKFLTDVLGVSEGTAMKMQNAFEAILETIGKIIKGIGTAIGFAIDLATKLTDALGITDSESAERTEQNRAAKARELRRRRGMSAAAAAQVRAINQLNTINSSVSVAVDARGQSNPAAIANAVGDKVSRVQAQRQTANAFATSR